MLCPAFSESRSLLTVNPPLPLCFLLFSFWLKVPSEHRPDLASTHQYSESGTINADLLHDLERNKPVKFDRHRHGSTSSSAFKGVRRPLHETRCSSWGDGLC